VLQLTGVTSTTTAVTLSIYRLSVPLKPVGDRSTGFAAEYPQDQWICYDPRVIYCETWDRNPQDWWKKTNGYYNLDRPTAWRESNGVKFPRAWLYTTFEPNGGFIGAGLHNVIQGDSMGGSSTPSVWLDQEYEHLFFHYYIKFGANFRDAFGCDGGKLPGFAGRTNIAGNSGDGSNGLNGWSLRQDYRLDCDTANPMYPRTRIVTYAYLISEMSQQTAGDAQRKPGRARARRGAG
jgi:hypothetical protein